MVFLLSLFRIDSLDDLGRSRLLCDSRHGFSVMSSPDWSSVVPKLGESLRNGKRWDTMDIYPMTDPWCWDANMTGVYWWDPWVTIYSIHMDIPWIYPKSDMTWPISMCKNSAIWIGRFFGVFFTQRFLAWAAYLFVQPPKKISGLRIYLVAHPT